jgi:hypothetical protein
MLLGMMPKLTHPSHEYARALAIKAICGKHEIFRHAEEAINPLVVVQNSLFLWQLHLRVEARPPKR